MQTACFWLTVTLYAVATVCFFIWIAFHKDAAGAWGRRLLCAGLLPHAAALGLRWAEIGHGPYSTRYEVISADTFLAVATFLVASAMAPGLRALGAMLAPVAFLMMGWSVSTFGLKKDVPIILKSYWLVLHVGFAKLFFASALLAAASATAFLVKERRPQALGYLPGPPRLDLYAHQFLLVSFLFCGVMIVAGSLWANQSWGRYWGWDPMETSALVTWLALAVILHFRVLHGWSGRKMAWLTLVAFGFAMTTIYVVAVVAPSIHNAYMVGR